MEEGTIRKLLNYYLKKPAFEEEVLRALGEFFDKSKLSSLDGFKIEEEDESRFNEWFVFDFCLKNGMTLLEDFYQRNPYNLSTARLQIYKDLQDNEYGVFEILEVRLGEGFRLRNLRTEKESEVREYRGTFQLKKGELVIVRVGKVGNHLELVGSDSYKLPKNSKHPLLGQLVMNPKLDVKAVRDFFRQMERVRKAGYKSMKKKILDGGRCICDICGKKGKIGAFSYIKKTGEPIVVCYKCNLKEIAKKDGITQKEAEKRRKRMFEVTYLFQEVKMKEYFTLKNRKKEDSLEEYNKALERITNAWNNLTVSQRKGFEKIGNEELRKIFKKILVDFSCL